MEIMNKWRVLELAPENFESQNLISTITYTISSEILYLYIFHSFGVLSKFGQGGQDLKLKLYKGKAELRRGTGMLT